MLGIADASKGVESISLKQLSNSGVHTQSVIRARSAIAPEVSFGVACRLATGKRRRGIGAAEVSKKLKETI
jgi:hypothetical protein